MLLYDAKLPQPQPLIRPQSCTYPNALFQIAPVRTGLPRARSRAYQRRARPKPLRQGPRVSFSHFGPKFCVSEKPAMTSGAGSQDPNFLLNGSEIHVGTYMYLKNSVAKSRRVPHTLPLPCVLKRAPVDSHQIGSQASFGGDLGAILAQNLKSWKINILVPSFQKGRCFKPRGARARGRATIPGSGLWTGLFIPFGLGLDPLFPGRAQGWKVRGQARGGLFIPSGLGSLFSGRAGLSGQPRSGRGDLK